MELGTSARTAARVDFPRVEDATVERTTAGNGRKNERSALINGNFVLGQTPDRPIDGLPVVTSFRDYASSYSRSMVSIPPIPTNLLLVRRLVPATDTPRVLPLHHRPMKRHPAGKCLHSRASPSRPRIPSNHPLERGSGMICILCESGVEQAISVGET
eukprot:scaffold2519_cov168-Amphora_coffeaeformis.AAC.6